MGTGDWRRIPRPADRANPPPPFPYCRALVISIKRHLPPPPFGNAGYTNPQRRLTVLPGPGETASSRVEYLLQNQPTPGQPHPDDSIHSLEIVDQIAASYGRGPQVVLCQLDRQKEAVVAKIFDPLYYQQSLIPDAADCSADAHYSCEAAAYEKVQQAGVDGKYLPKYYGSWTFDMPLAGKQRQVRMILIEHIPGKSLISMIMNDEYKKYDLETRLEVVAKAMEKYAMLVYYGVEQRDLHPRNVILGHDMKVTIIDLGVSSVTGLPNSKPLYPKQLRPPSPMDFNFSEVDAWVPEKQCLHGSWDDPMDEWGERRWEGCEMFEPSARLVRIRKLKEDRERERQEEIRERKRQEEAESSGTSSGTSYCGISSSSER